MMEPFPIVDRVMSDVEDSESMTELRLRVTLRSVALRVVLFIRELLVIIDETALELVVVVFRMLELVIVELLMTLPVMKELLLWEPRRLELMMVPFCTTLLLMTAPRRVAFDMVALLMVQLVRVEEKMVALRTLQVFRLL